MVCEARRLGGLTPTAADLTFHRQLVAEIRASLRERRLTVGERLKVLIELEHHRQHQDDITTALYTGTPMPAEELRPPVYRLLRATIGTRSPPIHELPASGAVEAILQGRNQRPRAYSLRIR